MKCAADVSMSCDNEADCPGECGFCTEHCCCGAEEYCKEEPESIRGV